MFGFLKRKNPYEQEAKALYAKCLKQARQQQFYADYGVPDTLDGRFDLLLVHIFLVIQHELAHNQKDGAKINQALFDACFADMDQTLRESGIGDMGIPKHMRRMMKAFNGRMHAYKAATDQNQAALEEALKRNLYGTLDQPKPDQIKAMAAYMMRAADQMNTLKAA